MSLGCLLRRPICETNLLHCQIPKSEVILLEIVTRIGFASFENYLRSSAFALVIVRRQIGSVIDRHTSGTSQIHVGVAFARTKPWASKGDE